MSRLRALTDGVRLVNPEIITHENGGEYFIINILPSSRTIATTTTGKVMIRISDNCNSESSEELTDLAAEKNAFQWELVVAQKISLAQADADQIAFFLSNIKKSEKVSDFIRQKSDDEILEFYQLLSPEGYLTNLGVLWLGTAAQRARLSYPITFQFLVYNDREEKIREKKIPLSPLQSYAVAVGNRKGSCRANLCQPANQRAFSGIGKRLSQGGHQGIVGQQHCS